MKAARLHAALDIRIDEVPTPTLEVGEVLVRVRAVAICASDVHLYEDGRMGSAVPDHPFTSGHEFSGEIAALGPGVDGPPIGTRVAIEPSWSCGECDLCRRGLSNLCRNIIFPSYPQRDGALAEYIACPATSVAPLPHSVSYAAGAMLEPLGVGMHAVRLAVLEPGEKVAILGCGAIGACVMLTIQAWGSQPIALVEPVAGRREVTRRMGAEPVAADLDGLLASGYEADVIFECSGAAEALEQAMRLARPAGKVVVVGIPSPDVVAFDSQFPRRKQLTVLFSRRSLNTLEEGIGLLSTGKVSFDLLPTREFTLDQAAEAMALTATRPGDMLRAIVIP